MKVLSRQFEQKSNLFLVFKSLLIALFLFVNAANELRAQELVFHFLNVGLGDGFLIEFPYRLTYQAEIPQSQISNGGVFFAPETEIRKGLLVLDGGSKKNSKTFIHVLLAGDTYAEYVRTLLGYLQLSNRIEILLITHPHSDHSNFLPYLWGINFGRIVYPGGNEGLYGNVIEILGKMGITNLGQIITEGSPPKEPIFINHFNASLPDGFEMNVISRHEINQWFPDHYTNKYSAILHIVSEPFQFRAILAGDATKEVWQGASPDTLLQNYTTLFKLAHHGSDTHGSNSEYANLKVQPNIVVISTGNYPNFHLPKCNIICSHTGLVNHGLIGHRLFTLSDPVKLLCYARPGESIAFSETDGCKTTGVINEDPELPEMGGFVQDYQLIEIELHKAIFSTNTVGQINVVPCAPGETAILLPNEGFRYYCTLDGEGSGFCAKSFLPRPDKPFLPDTSNREHWCEPPLIDDGVEGVDPGGMAVDAEGIDPEGMAVDDDQGMAVDDENLDAEMGE